MAHQNLIPDLCTSFSYILDQDLKAFRSQLNLLANARHAQEIELRIVPRQGEPVDAWLKVGPVRDAGGRVVALRWLVRDITERKRAEERVRKLNEELEERVRERTADLQAASEMKEVLLARMQEACDRAEAASRSKDEFLAMVSHELRTPLNAVVGWIEILRRKPDDPAMMGRALDVIERNTKAQLQIVNDILDVSRMTTGNLKLEFQPVDLNTVLEKAVEAITPFVNANGLRLNISIDGPVGPVLGDADRLQQIVGNLLTNAVKFTPSGGSMDVRLAQSGTQAQIIVSDTGKGIAADFLPHVFDMFRQDDTTSRRKFGGLGLGLSIVRLLVEMHSGAIRAESEGEGRGSTFIVTLPIASGVQQAFDGFAEAAESGSDQEAALNHRLEGVRILAVDDEADTVEMLRVVFEQLGAKVTTALSCAEAIEVMDGSNRPDVLIADIAMPEENGYDLIRKVRSRGSERGGNIPAIALTAYAGPEDRLRTMTEGFQIHLAKPVSIRDLISSVVKLAYRG